MTFTARLPGFTRSNPKAGEIFNEAMGQVRNGTSPSVTNSYNWSKFTTIADIGGGVSVQLNSILDASSVEGQDQEKIRELIRRTPTRFNLADHQAFDLGLSNGRGAIEIEVTAEQLRKLKGRAHEGGRIQQVNRLRAYGPDRDDCRQHNPRDPDGEPSTPIQRELI